MPLGQGSEERNYTLCETCGARYGSAITNSEVCAGQYDLHPKNREAEMLQGGADCLEDIYQMRAKNANRH